MYALNNHVRLITLFYDISFIFSVVPLSSFGKFSVCSNYTCICNTFTPQIKGNFCGLNAIYHNHSSPYVLQLSWCATTSQWNIIQLPIGMHIMMLQLTLVCYNDATNPIQTSQIITLNIDTPYKLSIVGSNLLVIN